MTTARHSGVPSIRPSRIGLDVRDYLFLAATLVSAAVAVIAGMTS